MIPSLVSCRLTICIVLAFSFVALGSEGLFAQDAAPADPNAAPPKEEPTEKREFRGILPLYYSQVVSPIQRRKIYAIQEEYEQQIDVLRMQIKALEAKRDEEIEDLLYEEQRVELDRIRKEAAAKQKADDEKKQATAEAEQPTSEAGTTEATTTSPGESS